VQATPTFFINGRKLEGALTLEDLDEAIQPLL
jgi:protein-disulfide isomerase